MCAGPQVWDLRPAHDWQGEATAWHSWASGRIISGRWGQWEVGVLLADFASPPFLSYVWDLEFLSSIYVNPGPPASLPCLSHMEVESLSFYNVLSHCLLPHALSPYILSLSLSLSPFASESRERACPQLLQLCYDFMGKLVFTSAFSCPPLLLRQIWCH